MSSNETTLHFVKIGEFSGKYLKQAFESAKSKKLDVELVSGRKLLEQGVDEDRVTFVTDEFTGDVFELLLAHKKRIFGPMCVLQCVENEIPLPNPNHPVYCLAMTGAIVCCTNIENSLRKRFKTIIEFMNGAYAKDFTTQVTHLVAGEVGSAKYAIAAKYQKPIVLPSWINEAWKKVGNDYQIDATDSKFVDEHRCPILKGCSICVSGLNARRKEEVKRLVEEHGGNYLAELRQSESTHLLIEKPTGQKYQFALRWSVYCILPDWLHDCIKTGYWLEETAYKLKSGKDVNKDVNTTSNVEDGLTTINATVNSTVSNSDISRKAEMAARQSAESYGNKDILNQSLTRVRASGLKRLNKSRHKSKDSTCDYDVPIPSGEQFLDGCQLYLTGFNEAQMDYLQRIVNAGGATRFNQINPSVTHIVVGDESMQEIEKMVNSEFAPHVVKVQWLLESCRQIKCLPEQEYYCFELNNEVFEEDRKSNLECDNKKSNAQQEMDDNYDNEILKQYLNVMPVDEQSVDKEQVEVDEGIFEGLKMRLDGFNEEQVVQLQEEIEEHGGNVILNESKTMADFLIVPLNYECEKKKAKTVVTYCWLERCMESGEMLEPSSEFLFSPFSLDDDVLPLQDCVISVSQYADVKRVHLTQLIEILGGHFQEWFSRTAKANLPANTHLILEEPLGSKYKAAVEWSIPALSSEWLYQCARTGEKVPETPYLLDPKKPAEVKQDHTGIEKAGKGHEEQSNDIKSAFTKFTVPESREVGMVKIHQETIDKSEALLLKQKAKDKEVTSSSKQPMLMNVPAFFGKPQRPSFDLTDALEYLQSPCASSGSSSAHSCLSRGSRNSFLMDDYIQEHLQAGLKNTGNLLEARKVKHKDTVDKEAFTVDKEGFTVDKEGFTVDKEGSTIDKEGFTVDKEGSTFDKERFTVDKEGSTFDRGETNVDKDDHEDGSNESLFLRGVVLFVSKKCAKQFSDINKMATSADAQCRDNMDTNCSHVIHEGRLTKEQTRMKSKGVHIVSPHWLYDCIEQKCRLDESLYPPGYNPKLALSVVKTRRSTRSTKSLGDETIAVLPDVKPDKLHEVSTESLSKKETREELMELPETTSEIPNDEDMDDFTMDELEAIAAMSQSSAQSDSLRNREEIKRIQAIMKSMESMKTTRRRSSRIHHSGNSSHSRNSSESNETKNSRRPSSRLRSLRSSKNESQEDDEDDDQTIAGEITYDDPNSRQERQKIIAKLEDISPSLNQEPSNETLNQSTKPDGFSYNKHPIKKESLSPSSPIHSSTPTATAPPIALHITSKSNLPQPMSLLDPQEEVVKVERKPPPMFTLSTMSQQEKVDYGALIEDLGGVVFDTQFFNPKSRHTIAGQLNRNEKCLSSIAAGNWLLRKSYLEECRVTGRFIDEEPHEWGVEIPGEPLTSLGVASRRWRIDLSKKSERYGKKFGAFQDWKILLCVDKNKAGSFTRMLDAGGAKVLGTTPPFQNIGEATHAFISPGASLVNNVDFGRLQQAGIQVLKTEYIVDYLTAGNSSPDTSKYLYRSSSSMSSRKRKERDSSFPETPGKKKRAN